MLNEVDIFSGYIWDFGCLSQFLLLESEVEGDFEMEGNANDRLTIKKKMNDCSVLGCRLVLILDDLLWVLTDDQLKAALHFADSLSGLLKRATAVTQKVKGARKLEVRRSSSSQSVAAAKFRGARNAVCLSPKISPISATLHFLHHDHASSQSLSAFQEKSKESSGRRKSQQQSACAAARVFARYDVIETSYHFYSDRIDLHLCDDPGGSESIISITNIALVQIGSIVFYP